MTGGPTAMSSVLSCAVVRAWNHPRYNMISSSLTKRALVFAMAALLASTAATATAGTLSYNFSICEDQSVLQNPIDSTIAGIAGAQPQHSLMVERNMPYIRLENTSDTAQIQRLKLTVG